MKTLTYFLSLSLLFTIMACRNKKPTPQPISPVEQLPLYTETGANTFGCLIDGEVFLPGKKVFNSAIIFQCEYQYVNGKYIFSLAAKDLKSKHQNAVIIGGNSMYDFIVDDSVYVLGEIPLNLIRGGVGRSYSDSSWNNDYNYKTNSNFKGQLHIKNFNLSKQIVSGTFWFDAIDTATGKIIHVTEGRFDTHFYR